MNKTTKQHKINESELLLANAFLKKHFDRIIDWVIGDIKKCCNMTRDGTCNKDGALVGAFILWCCALDYFGGLLTNNSNNGGTKKRYKEFISTYMSKYDYEKIYDLRWSLLHYYSPHHFVLYHENNLNNNKNKHLSISNRGIMLHLGWAVKDVENAVVHYKVDLKKDDKLKIKVWRYYQKQLPIMPVKVEEIYSSNLLNSLTTNTSIQSTPALGTTSQDHWDK